MDTDQTLRLAFGLSLAGGILILVGSLVGLLFMSVFSYFVASPMGPGFDGPPFFPAFFVGFWVLMTVVGLASGAVVIWGATALRRVPPDPRRAGIVILVGAGVSLLGMGGFMMGAVLAGVGGVLALVAEPARAPAAAPVPPP